MASGGVRRPRVANVPRRVRPGAGQLSLFETDVPQVGQGPVHVREAKRAVPNQTTNSNGRRNLRALQAEPINEPLPTMKSFDSSRIAEAGYSSTSRTLYVRFVDGTPWLYNNVEANVWKNLQRSASPGKFVNRVLNNYSYGRADF